MAKSRGTSGKSDRSRHAAKPKAAKPAKRPVKLSTSQASHRRPAAGGAKAPPKAPASVRPGMRARPSATAKRVEKPAKGRGESLAEVAAQKPASKQTSSLVQSSEIRVRRPAGSRPAPRPAPRPAVPANPVQIQPVRLPPPPVTTDSKPKRNRAGLSQRELAAFRDLLLAKRRELLGDMTSMEREALRSQGSNLSNLPVHMADMGTDNYEQEFTLGLVEKDRILLREINAALAKIQDGTYGICEGTGQPISKARLEAKPWARYSIEYARMLEKGLVRRAI